MQAPRCIFAVFKCCSLIRADKSHALRNEDLIFILLVPTMCSLHGSGTGLTLASAKSNSLAVSMMGMDDRFVPARLFRWLWEVGKGQEYACAGCDSRVLEPSACFRTCTTSRRSPINSNATWSPACMLCASAKSRHPCTPSSRHLLSSMRMVFTLISKALLRPVQVTRHRLNEKKIAEQ